MVVSAAVASVWKGSWVRKFVCWQWPSCRCRSRALWTSGCCSFSIPTVHSVEGCLGCLTAVATLAHELSWTSVLQQGPPPLCRLTVRDCVPSKYCGYTIWPHCKCLHAYTQPKGIGASNMVSLRKTPLGCSVVAQKCLFRCLVVPSL